ncbi:MAG: tRNA (adenosine(37)-N6)-threonylcarbamoyltransferase complex ATPase subunit type 1 TsaE, partial [Campylobacteraceae bacterium]|nr:tRNA (adenosine(37)-N6)-threonylcarbamoyltransferase complex ATPase subunit type 1 TsaE [Campylobacteraceae bacterium]
MISSLTNINQVINKLKDDIDNKNIVVLLQGDLASGKTTLVKHYVKS